ncbi:hypothetical protein [Streptomyces galilaeus]|nr:hypothetical protein [Streptomyces galilaeus]GGW62141.1 hypothetical protein GCM10010350_53550 [Streptomyces galilaeus]
MPQNTQSEPAEPVFAEADRAVEATGAKGTSAGLPDNPAVPRPGFAAVTR